ncbi:MAG: ABC transporter permease [Candidatus Marinimicrobia bacterium]|nr:ABC transporter permease [Candidatus Neomarinimicrobiota bacterium]
MIRLLLENFQIAVTAIVGGKIRALLTALGIVIGILSVTLMGTLISGLDQSFEKSMSFLGRDVFFLSRFEWFGGQEWWEVRNRPKFKLDYVDKLKEQGKRIETVAPVMERGLDVSRGEESVVGVRIFGTTPEYQRTTVVNIKHGRFITEGEVRSGSRHAVIGWDIADGLFGNENPIGKDIKLGNHRFTVIGVVEKQGKFLGLFSLDNQVVIPIGTYQRLFARRGWMRMNVKVDADHVNEAEDEVRGIMRRLRGLHPQEKDNFAINRQEAFRKQYNMIKYAIGGTGIFITVLSLLVGGIGIMNIMFVSVKERTREIGVRKAIGATRNMILGQFLLEAVLICVLGGAIGMGLAWGASFFIDKFIPSTMPVWLAIISVSLSVVVGVIAGLIPSYKAANMNPIEALRYE